MFSHRSLKPLKNYFKVFMSNLPETTKMDAEKIIHCFIYILDHMDYII